MACLVGRQRPLPDGKFLLVGSTTLPSQKCSSENTRGTTPGIGVSRRQDNRSKTRAPSGRLDIRQAAQDREDELLEM